MKIAYLMSRFPKITETFVLYEILALEDQGVPVEVFPLLRTRERVTHPEARALVQRAHFHPFLSLPILRAHWRFIRRRPRAYFAVLFEVLRGTWGSANFFIGALAIFPKVVSFADEMLRQGVTHVHAHFANHPALAALIIHRLTGIPFSFTAHGSDVYVERRMLKKKVEAAAFVVTISSYNKELLVQECGDVWRHKLHVVHCGVDPGVFSPRPERTGDGTFRIVCVASLEEKKGHKILIEACRFLRNRKVEVICHLVGEGPLRRQIETGIQSAGLRDTLLVHGARPRNEVAKLVSDADVVALASIPMRNGRCEGIPVVLMEAMASGIPVVATRISGVPELVESGSTGLLVPPGDARQLADALHRVQQDRELRCRMGKAGREKVLRDFNLRKSAAMLAQLFGGNSAPTQSFSLS